MAVNMGCASRRSSNLWISLCISKIVPQFSDRICHSKVLHCAQGTKTSEDSSHFFLVGQLAVSAILGCQLNCCKHHTRMPGALPLHKGTRINLHFSLALVPRRFVLFPICNVKYILSERYWLSFVFLLLFLDTGCVHLISLMWLEDVIASSSS